MSQNSFFFRTVGLLFLIGLVFIGGFIAFRAGVAQGFAQAPAIADTVQNEQTIVSPSFGYGYVYGFPPFGGICISILFVFLFFGLLRFVFCPIRGCRKDEVNPNVADTKPTL